MRINREAIGFLKIGNSKIEKAQEEEKCQKEEFIRKNNNNCKPKKISLSSSEALELLEKDINTNTKKTEKFSDVRAEMDENVPDSTSTIEEKELALSYINRMLACDDITPELKNYWNNKKDIIEMEIQTIKNEQQIGNDKSITDIAKEWKEFTDRYWNKTPVFDNTADRVEYYRSYYNMYISFCDRVLALNNISEEDRAEWTRMKQGAISDLNYHNRDLNRYNKENNIKTESFFDVYKEFDSNVPDSTKTKAEKFLALSYIERMLSCDDIPDNLRVYWQNKKEVIKKELEQF